MSGRLLVATGQKRKVRHRGGGGGGGGASGGAPHFSHPVPAYKCRQTPSCPT